MNNPKGLVASNSGDLNHTIEDERISGRTLDKKKRD